MRFAIKTRPEHTSWEPMRDVWVAADDIEIFESAWNWDHFYPLTPPFTDANFEAWTMLGAMAQATRRIRIGCQVTGMIYRHPALLANMAATVDIISGGRLEIGIGAGWNQMECDAYGLRLPPLRERFDRFDEGVQSMIALMSETVANYSGQYITLTDARCEPKPIQRPHPPIVIGGKGPKRTLRAVARWAQQWNCISDVETWRGLKEVLLQHCADLGRDPNEITCSVNVIIDPATGIGPAVAKVAEFREAGADLAVINLPHRSEPKILEPLAEALAPLA